MAQPTTILIAILEQKPAMTSKAKRRAAARKSILPLMREVAEASNKLADWRRDAGVKSKWSNHVRIQEAGLFGDFERKLRTLTDAFVPLIPAEWDMGDWSFKAHRMGGKISWRNKGGKGRSGFDISTQDQTYGRNYSRFAAEIGGLVALATRAPAPTEEEAARMKMLRLSGKERMRFAIFQSQRNWMEADGASPTEAMALLLLRGEASHFVLPSNATSEPSKAFHEGIERTDELLDRPKRWSASPTFFSQLKSDRRARKLAGAVPEAHRSGRIGPDHAEAFDRQTAMALALLDALPPEPGKVQDFLVRPRGAIGFMFVGGWCATSACLGVLLKHLYQTKIDNNDVLNWEVYAATDERGLRTRQIAAEFEPFLTK